MDKIILNRNASSYYRVLKEIIVVFLLGSVPLLIAAKTETGEELVDLVKSMQSHKIIWVYAGICGAIFVVVAYADYRINWPEKYKRIHHLFSDIFYELASSLISILQVTSGLLLAIPMLWISAGFYSQLLEEMTYILLLGIVGLTECIILNESLGNIKKKWMYRSSTIT